MEDASQTGIFVDELVVPESAIDVNGHVNNVVFVQWMQDVAIKHFNSIIPLRTLREMGAIWVVRSHQIEYLAPAFAGDRIALQTWIVNFSRVRSLRRYRFVRTSDGKPIVRGETDWVYVELNTGRPCSIPPEIKEAFAVSDEK